MSSVSYRVIQIYPLTQSISCLLLQPETADTLTYQAGQYLYVLHHDQTLSPLSIACAPRQDFTIELHLSHHANNALAQDILQMVQQEKKLRLQGPNGICTVQRFLPNLPIILIARGTGFAPIKALLEEWMQRAMQPNIHLFWDAAVEKHFYMLSFLEACSEYFQQFQVTKVLSAAEDTQKVCAAVLAIYPDVSTYQVYASGSYEMVIGALEKFQEYGLSKEYFYSDIV